MSGNETKIDAVGVIAAAIQAQTDQIVFQSGDVKATLAGEEVDVGSIKATGVTGPDDLKADAARSRVEVVILGRSITEPVIFWPGSWMPRRPVIMELRMQAAKFPTKSNSTAYSRNGQIFSGSTWIK